MRCGWLLGKRETGNGKREYRASVRLSTFPFSLFPFPVFQQ